MTDRIQIESEAYRRGVVLGLTLAEVGILLVFVLLMLVGFEHYRQANEAGQASVPRDELEALRSRDAALRELEQSLPGNQGPISDDFIRLVLDAARRIDHDDVLAHLREVTAGLEVTRRELQSALNAAGRGQLSEQIERQAREVAAGRQRITRLEAELADANERNEGRRGQIAQLRRILDSEGHGRVYPSCGTTADGRVLYVYDVRLTDAGLEVRSQAALSEAGLPEIADLSGRLLSPAEFLRLTAPLYRWSLAHDCRFFVRVYDATGPREKTRFKSLLATVEAHFYKYLSSRAEPGP